LLWVSKSQRILSAALAERGFTAGLSGISCVWGGFTD
jgi:hypothetical protein